MEKDLTIDNIPLPNSLKPEAPVEQVSTVPPQEQAVTPIAQNELLLPAPDDPIEATLPEDYETAPGMVVARGSRCFLKVDHTIKARWAGNRWEFFVMPRHMDELWVVSGPIPHTWLAVD